MDTAKCCTCGAEWVVIRVVFESADLGKPIPCRGCKSPTLQLPNGQPVTFGWDGTLPDDFEVPHPPSDPAEFDKWASTLPICPPEILDGKRKK